MLVWMLSPLHGAAGAGNGPLWGLVAKRSMSRVPERSDWMVRPSHRASACAVHGHGALSARSRPSQRSFRPMLESTMTKVMHLDQKSWLHRSDAIQGMERIEAFFQGNAYGMHRHDTYAIGCTMAGVQAFHYRGAHRQSLPGHTMDAASRRGARRPSGNG